jgi:hypothetical protein
MSWSGIESLPSVRDFVDFRSCRIVMFHVNRNTPFVENNRCYVIMTSVTKMSRNSVYIGSPMSMTFSALVTESWLYKHSIFCGVKYFTTKF